MSDKGQSHLVFAAGTLLGVLTIGLLGVNTFYYFSPVLKIAVFLLFSLFLALIARRADKLLEYSLYLLSFTSFVMVLNLGLNISRIGVTNYLAVAALGSVVLLGTGYALQKGYIRPPSKHLEAYAAIVLCVLVLISAYDLSGDQPRYTFIPTDSPEINKTGGMELGKMAVYNRCSFPRVLKIPGYRACIYDSEGSLLETGITFDNTEAINGEDLLAFEARATIDQELAGNILVEQMKVVKASKCVSENSTNEVRIVPSETE